MHNVGEVKYTIDNASDNEKSNIVVEIFINDQKYFDTDKNNIVVDLKYVEIYRNPWNTIYEFIENLTSIKVNVY